MTSDRDHESDEPVRTDAAARTVALVALLPLLVFACVVLTLADLVRVSERGIRRWI